MKALLLFKFKQKHMDKKNKDWIDNLAKNYKISNVSSQKEPNRILTENQIKTIKESK